MHGLTASQLSELQGAVEALDAYLLLCVDDLRNDRWARPNAKHVADCLVRELARNVAHRFQVKPITDSVTLDHRTKLLTRRVRATMRAFNKNPNYLNTTPNIIWDDSFVPPELYDNLEIELESLDAKRSKKEEEEEEKVNMEEQMNKEMDKATQNDKGKGKETAQEEDATRKPKRKWMRKTSENSPMFDIASDNEDNSSADEDEPPAKRVKRNKSIDDVDIIPVPPCRECTSSQMECKPNDRGIACKNCQKARRTCSFSKALQNEKGKAKETADDNEMHGDTEKPKIQKLREIHTSSHALTKSIPDDRSSIEDEDEILHNSPPPKKKKKVSTTMIDVFIPNDPKCDRCERSHRQCVRKEAQDHGPCTQCAKLKQGCSLTNLKSESKIKFIPNDPRCDRCERSNKECVREETQDHGTKCTQCTKLKQGCSLTNLEGQSKIKFISNDPKCDRCEKSHKECVKQDGSTRCTQYAKLKQGCSLTNLKGESKIKYIPNDPKCDRCERSNKECVREETQDHGTKCTQCTRSKQGCSLTNLESQSKIKFIPNIPKCNRCERYNRDCVREETQDHGTQCTQCARLKLGCSLTNLKGQSKIKFTSNDPKCDRCEKSHKECIKQDNSTRCKQCVKDHQVCKYLSKSPSKMIKSKPTPKASKSMEENSSSSSSSRNFELELMQQQLKASQEDLRIAQQQLQLANSRLETQKNLYEAQLEGYRGQGSGKVKQWAYERRIP